MDPRLKVVLDDVNHIDSINNQKRFLKEKFQEDIVLFYNGGKFTITNSFIAFAKEASESNINYIVDDSDIPVEIENPKDFYKKVLDTYTQATTKYYTEYDLLVKNSRKIEDLLSI